jgi:hypothetical protein
MAEYPLHAGYRFRPGQALSGEVEIGPPGAEADHDGDQPHGHSERADRLAGHPPTTPVRVSPSTMMMNAPNRSVSESVTVIAAARVGATVRITAANPAR